MKNNNSIALLLSTAAVYFFVDIAAIAAGLDIGIGSNGFYFGIGGGEAAGGIARALCTIAGWFQGGIGQAIASLAIIFLGISAFFGKVTWGTALTFAVGIFAIFGSADIVRAIVGGSSAGGWSGFISSTGFGVSYSSGSSCGGF